ncbi:hypothetical protein GCM10010272_71220 [Streptomyces lateritius]|nr:hypothetical protein GCM10010272_71220 [Streptomyces lateritius]
MRGFASLRASVTTAATPPAVKAVGAVLPKGSYAPIDFGPRPRSESPRPRQLSVPGPSGVPPTRSRPADSPRVQERKTTS